MATALSGDNVTSDAVAELNAFIDADGATNRELLRFAVGNVNNNGVIVNYNNSETAAQVVFENDIPQGGMDLGSVLSQGNLWLVMIIAVLAVGFIIVLVVVKKKREKASAE